MQISIPQGVCDDEKTISIDLGKGVMLEMVRIPAGTFIMGSPVPTWHESEISAHTVTISKDYYIGRYEVTQGQWKTIMDGANPSRFKIGDDYPVENVSWDDICRGDGFLKKINALTGKNFRLPTEAEWEYACRAGQDADFYWGDDPTHELTGSYAWYWDASSSENSSTHPVGLKTPNAFGLYDMSGNVWEWCNDSYESYDDSPVTDPRLSEVPFGPYRVNRGGSWHHSADACRSAFRNGNSPSERYNFLGFRLALSTSRL